MNELSKNINNYVTDKLKEYNEPNVLIFNSTNYLSSLLSNYTKVTSIDKLDDFYVKDYCKLPFADNEFDVSIVVQPSETEKQTNIVKSLFSEFLRILRPNGLCIIIDNVNIISDSTLLEQSIIESTEVLSKDLSGVSIIKHEKEPDLFNAVLTKDLLRKYLNYYANDQVLIDLILMDFWARKHSLSIVSSGRYSDQSYILERSYRIWEYRQIIKGLELDKKQKSTLLDIGGASCHLTYYAALQGNNVVSLDINPEIVGFQQKTSEFMNINSLNTYVKDMRDLSDYADNTFDMAMSASVFEHLNEEDQIKAMKEIARVVKPGGKIAISFDFGIPAPGQNPDLPPPHEPPSSSSEVIRRYSTESGLEIVSEPSYDYIYPYWDTVYYAPAFLLLRKTGGQANQTDNLLNEWNVSDSILYPNFFDITLLSELAGYLIEYSGVSAIDSQEILKNLELKVARNNKDREDRLSVINKQLSIIEDLQKNINEIENDRAERLEIILRQQDQLNQLKNNINNINEDNEEKTRKNNEQYQLINEKDALIEKQQKEMNNLQIKLTEQDNLIESIENDREARLQVILKQEKIIEELREELNTNLGELNKYKSDRLIRIITKWRLKDGK